MFRAASRCCQASVNPASRASCSKKARWVRPLPSRNGGSRCHHQLPCARLASTCACTWPPTIRMTTYSRGKPIYWTPSRWPTGRTRRARPLGDHEPGTFGGTRASVKDCMVWVARLPPVLLQELPDQLPPRPVISRPGWCMARSAMVIARYPATAGPPSCRSSCLQGYGAVSGQPRSAASMPALRSRLASRNGSAPLIHQPARPES
jgi:hypothetical protein